MKKVIILYDSVYGNTKKVAMSLTRGLEAGGLYVDSISIQDFDITRLKSYDIIGIGGPTHFHGASKQMKSFLNRIKHLKMVDKYGFAFETKGDFRLAGSAAKRITKYLKKIKVKIINSAITGIVLDKEGPLQETTLDTMEQIGLKISDKINHSNTQNFDHQVIQNIKKSTLKTYLNRVKWILLGGGPIFFFIRAIFLACTGGDCFGTINPIFSWILLSLEIGLSGTAGISGIAGLIFWIKKENQVRIHKKKNTKKIVSFVGISTYIVHFVRVAIWLILCVI
ncbi:MAG: flavodoxin domain-containing protein [Promethearchaeota archaeon]